MLTVLKKNIQKILIITFQLIILVVIRLLFTHKVKLHIPAKQKIKAPVVIASNHKNELDPFIITCFLPLRVIFSTFPYAFMTANIYYYKWWRPLAFLAGCYPAKPRHINESLKKSGVAKSVELLADGYSVIMFPEGKRTGTRIDAKPGISRILEQSSAPLLLCHINWSKSKTRQFIRVTIDEASKNLDRTNPDAIMEAIYGLSPTPKVVLAHKKA